MDRTILENFGTNSASEVFQKIISSNIQNINGTKNISGDIKVYEQNRKDHDRALLQVFHAFHNNGLTLNRKNVNSTKKIPHSLVCSGKAVFNQTQYKLKQLWICNSPLMYQCQ